LVLFDHSLCIAKLPAAIFTFAAQPWPDLIQEHAGRSG
jgi:hypothetical protein